MKRSSKRLLNRSLAALGVLVLAAGTLAAHGHAVIGNRASHGFDGAICQARLGDVNDLEPVARLSGSPGIIVGRIERRRPAIRAANSKREG